MHIACVIHFTALDSNRNQCKNACSNELSIYTAWGTPATRCTVAPRPLALQFADVTITSESNITHCSLTRCLLHPSRTSLLAPARTRRCALAQLVVKSGWLQERRLPAGASWPRSRTGKRNNQKKKKSLFNFAESFRIICKAHFRFWV